MKSYIVFTYCLSAIQIFSVAQSVGIGTGAPSDALHVISAANDDALRVQVGTATKLRVLNNGGTSLGTNNVAGTPANGLYVQGNTGLGINSPNDKLAVGGDVNITGQIKTNGVAGTAGSVLVSNGNGTMSWADPGQYKNYASYPTPGFHSWTVPAGVTQIMVEVWGAGGGGGITNGGGGGGYIKFYRSVTENQVLEFTVGLGGQGVSTTGANPSSGGYSEFPFENGIYTAYGGSAGNVGFSGQASVSNGNRAIARYGTAAEAKETFYMPISATVYAQKIIYGKGGASEGNPYGGGNGCIVTQNTTTNGYIDISLARDGLQPGGGGGGAPGINQPVLLGGGKGGDGLVIIYW